MSAAAGVAGAALRPTPSRTFVTNGPVYAVAPTASAIYIGGHFSTVAPRTGPGVGIDASTAESTGLPQLAGGGQVVLAVVPDGSGGFYVGGNFASVGLFQQRNLTHILPNGRVDRGFHATAHGPVRALAVSGQTLYVGGNFDSIGGKPRDHIAALDAATGQVTSWNPDANKSVRALAVSGQTVYAGGAFDSIGGESRHRIAALNATTGQATGWNPDARSQSPFDGRTSIRALAVSGQTIYAGGLFDSIGGPTRHNIAALDARTGQATNWNPNASNSVEALAISGQTVYAGGWFGSIGGQPRNYIAAVDATTGAATGWDPNIARPGTGYAAPVHALAVSGQTVYVGGYFNSIGARPRSDIAAIDATTGEATGWNPNVEGMRTSSATAPRGSEVEVDALAVSGQTVYAGGRFTSIGGQARHNIAALDPATGAVTGWDPNAQGGLWNTKVEALAASGQTVYAGGSFDAIGGQPRKRIAALDATTGEATSWDPHPTGTASDPDWCWVDDLTVSGQTVYVGGAFNAIGGRARNNIAALDASTGRATSWDPNASSDVETLAIFGQTVYAGGWFESIGGQPRPRIAALNATTGQATSWDAEVTPYTVAVYTLAVSGQTVYVGGNFYGGSSIGGEPRNNIAALDASTGQATSWNPNATGRYAKVHALAISGQTVYAGGLFNTIGGRARNNLAALDATGAATAWDPKPNVEADIYAPAIGVTALAFAPDGSLWAGGTFTGFRGAPQSGIAKFAPLP